MPYNAEETALDEALTACAAIDGVASFQLPKGRQPLTVFVTDNADFPTIQLAVSAKMAQWGVLLEPGDIKIQRYADIVKPRPSSHIDALAAQSSDSIGMVR